MRVFISWSGSKSHDVAELLDEWIQCVLQAVRPWMSSKDIDRGALWFSEISDQLKDTKIGIVCLTKANIDKPWILFESGALAKGLSSARVCTFLIDLDSTDVGNPLAQFNHTLPTRDGLYHLVRTLNTALGESGLREKVLEQVFETYWPQFEAKFADIVSLDEESSPSPKRSEEEVMVEVLRTVRSMDRRIRHLEHDPERMRGERTRRMPPSVVRREVARRLADGLPPEVIEEMLRGMAPRTFIRDAIKECISEDEDQAGEDG